MSRERDYKHMVVMVTTFGNVIATTSEQSKEPAVYNDVAFAELRCAQLRDKFPQSKFAVIDFVVL